MIFLTNYIINYFVHLLFHVNDQLFFIIPVILINIKPLNFLIILLIVLIPKASHNIFKFFILLINNLNISVFHLSHLKEEPKNYLFQIKTLLKSLKVLFLIY